ncbi:MAG: 3'(2'),5'-bisphosphate nucleotidase [Desulfobacteraceae bacterium]|nr:MAG: 3'(2'),5'-bisphosphate nucleotidase [Desulfobacteraceae bacterium]
MNLKNLLHQSITAAIKAGSAILDVYHSGYAVEYKADDSPLTIADKRAHKIIVEILQKTGIPILSEEGKAIDYSVREKWDTLWIVDPLDGTKEFIKRNDEFTVNIALVKHHIPVLGVIFVPVSSALYFAAEGLGAWKTDASGWIREIGKRDMPEAEFLETVMGRSIALPFKSRKDDATCRIVGSRSHATPELDAYVDQKRKEYRDVAFLSAGSSLKFCLVAEGEADLYPRLGPTMEWDTAAGQAIAEQSGCRVLRWDSGAPLAYNRRDLLNPYFVVSRKQQ